MLHLIACCVVYWDIGITNGSVSIDSTVRHFPLCPMWTHWPVPVQSVMRAKSLSSDSLFSSRHSWWKHNELMLSSRAEVSNNPMDEREDFDRPCRRQSCKRRRGMDGKAKTNEDRVKTGEVRSRKVHEHIESRETRVSLRKGGHDILSGTNKPSLQL